MTALQTYVAAPDSNYNWEYHPEFDMKGDGYKVLWLNVTSQRWSETRCLLQGRKGGVGLHRACMRLPAKL